MRGAVPCLSADLTTHAARKLLTLQALKMRRRARCDGPRAAVMSEVSGDAVCGFLACLFPGLIVAMTATCAIFRRSDNPRLNVRRFHARVSAAAPGKTKRIVTTEAQIVAMTAVTPQRISGSLGVELELELIQPQMAHKPVLWGEVGARALRVRSVSREEIWASAGVQVQGAWVFGEWVWV